MKWHLRLVAAEREIWKASELHTRLGDAGLVISSGKMSGLWSGRPSSLKLDDLDVICAVLGCRVDELLTPELPAASRLSEPHLRVAGGDDSTRASVIPRSRSGRTLPPV